MISRIFFVVALVSILAPAVGPQELPGVAVMDFESIGGDPHLGPGVAENLRTALLQTGQFRVIERSALQKVLEEQKLQVTGLISPESAVKLGKLVGARLIVVGSVVKFANTYTLNVRFIDAETGVAIRAEKVQAGFEAEIPEMVDKVVEMIMGIYEPKPVPSPPPIPPIPDVVILAQQQAETDVNKLMWFGAGCLLGVFGVLGAYIWEPSPPTVALMGKPPEYISVYIREYKKKAKSLQAKYALYGCITWSVIYLLSMSAAAP